MTALKQRVSAAQQNIEMIKHQLELELAECTEAESTGRNRVREFMMENGIWHISELDYLTRTHYERILKRKYTDSAVRAYLTAYDRVKQHSVCKTLKVIGKGRYQYPIYKNDVFYLPYYPDPDVMKRFRKAVIKENLVWDFSNRVPEKMKHQIFDIICATVTSTQNNKSMYWKLSGLKSFYKFCCREKVEDVEQMELEQEEQFIAEATNGSAEGIVEYCRKTLFMLHEEICWSAPVWYLERFRLQPERTDPAKPVKRLSFLEVKSKHNRQMLQQYMKYGIGVTNLSIGNLRLELLYVRNFLAYLDREEKPDVCCVDQKQMDGYFAAVEARSILPASYNEQVMAILHFFNFLLARRYIINIPFNKDLYLKKEIPTHHDRAVQNEAIRQILLNLHRFPEKIRLMYLHLWALGLRISEVCALKGDAYYRHGSDTWIQVYQNKMKNYKQIPIPEALYKLMQVYLRKYGISKNDYVFPNRNGGAFRSATFQYNMKKYCKENHILWGEYIFRSHDYRHTVATSFYDAGVSIQGVRDYLGHEYEEMTRQYIDYMPKKIDQAGEEYFRKHESLATAILRKGEKENGR